MEATTRNSSLFRISQRLALMGVVLAGSSGCAFPNDECYATWSLLGGLNHGTCRQPEKDYKTETASQVILRKDEAAAGDQVAASHLGAHYAARESAEAWEWYCLAANQGENWSRVELGDWHRADVSRTPSRKEFLATISPDDRIAYMWYSLAATGGNRAGMIYQKELSKRLSQDELTEAEQMVRDWKPGDCPSAEHRLGMPVES